jgi:uncharacterized protein (DUF1697 family)
MFVFKILIMNRYIVLLRGINVSGKNKLQMADLRLLLESLGYKNIKTYIQSGNLLLNSSEDKATVSEKIENAIFKKFTYTVPVIIKTINEWEKIITDNPFSVEKEKIIAFVILSTKPENKMIDFKKSENDQFALIEDVVYLFCPNGFGKSKLTNSLFEKKLKVTATTRNYKTSIKLLELAKAF